MPMSVTFLNELKYSEGLLNAIKAASWKGAGAESVILTWMFLIAEAMQEGAIAHPIRQPKIMHDKINKLLHLNLL